MHLSCLFYSLRGPLTAGCHQPCPGDTGKGDFMYFMLNCWSLYFLCSRAVAQGTMRVAEDGAGWVSSKHWGWRFPQQREMGEQEGKKNPSEELFPCKQVLAFALLRSLCANLYTHKYTHSCHYRTKAWFAYLFVALLFFLFLNVKCKAEIGMNKTEQSETSAYVL